MKISFFAYPSLRPMILVSILLGSIGVSLFYGVDSVQSVPVLPVYGGVTGGCIPCVSFCGGTIATACFVAGPRPGRVMVDPRPGVGWTLVPPFITVPGFFAFYQLRDAVWWLGGGYPGGSCDIPAPHSGCIGVTITHTSLYNGSSMAVAPLPL